MPPLAVPSSLVITRPVTPSRFVELQRLRERVLALARIEHEHHLVGRRGIEPPDHALDLLEFVHQARRPVQPARGVREQDVDVRARAAATSASKTTAAGSAPGCLRDDRNAVALAPDLQLLDGRGAKGVAGGQHDRVARVLQAVGELADGRGLARAVDADHEDHERLVRGASIVERRFDGLAAGSPAPSAQQLARPDAARCARAGACASRR